MKEPEREVAVVREEERAARVEVETTHGDDTRRDLLQVFRDRRSPRGIAHGADDVSRLVEDEVVLLFREHALAVDLDPRRLRIGPTAELRDDLAVHGDPPRDDERLRLSAGRDSGASEDLLKAFSGHRGAH